MYGTSFLRLVTTLVDICNDPRREWATNEHLDTKRASDQLFGLQDVWILKKLLKAVTNPLELTTLAPSIGGVDGLSTKGKHAMGELEAALKQDIAQQKIKGQPSTVSSEKILSNLAPSTTRLRNIVDRYPS